MHPIWRTAMGCWHKGLPGTLASLCLVASCLLRAEAGAPLSFESVRLTNGPPTTVSLVWKAGADLKLPVILTLGSLKVDELPDWCRQLVEDGFLVAAFVTEYPPDPDPARRPVWLHFDRRFAHSYVLGGLRTPQDASRVIDYLGTRVDADVERIGWLGSSTTGIFGLAAATREPRIKALVAFVATGAYEKWFNTWRTNQLWQDANTALWPETMALLPNADPICRATNLFPCAVLLINGGADKVVDLTSARAFVEAARPAYPENSDRLRLVVYEGMGHNLPQDIITLYARHWFQLHLARNQRKAEVTSPTPNLAESARQTALTPTAHSDLVGAAQATASSVQDHERLIPWMPRPADYTLLWWADGPPGFLSSSEPLASEILCFQSGRWGMAFDTRQMRLLRLGSFPEVVPLTAAMAAVPHDLNTLPAADWHCELTVGEEKFVCAGHRKPKDEFYQPVQVVESGHFFQRVAITDLVFTSERSQAFPGTARLEISAWPDRLVVRLLVQGLAASGSRVEFRIGERAVSAKVDSKADLWLELAGGDSDRQVRADSEELPVAYDEALGSHVLALPEQAWSNRKGTYYPEEHLDRLDRWRLTLRNDSDQETTARLMFTQQQHLPITGFTPLLCFPDGAPTGIPVQISKNWHQRPEKGAMVHQGPWFHGFTFIRLPPRSQREFNFSMVYARYGGICAASHAQLCLIGWGHNQFWDQAAIGSFGESICFEPGRVQRRCFIDDIRPLMTLPKSPDAKPFGWAENCGGGDFVMWRDAQGHYQPFRSTRTDYRAQGPCLTEVTYGEETRGGELSERVTVSLPRSADHLRTFFQLRYDVRQPIRWERLAFFQLGTDFYNETPSRRVAFGDAQGVRKEWEPIRAKDLPDVRAIPLTGPVPWMSIHGLEPDALKSGTAAASRGLIVRRWQARLGSKEVPHPYLSTWCSEWPRGQHRTVLELSPPPNVTELQPGDFIEAELELVVFPAQATAYYGPDARFRATLEATPDTWQPVHREAQGNALGLKARLGTIIREYPIQVQVDDLQKAEIEATGGLGFVPITFTGLTQPRGYTLSLDTERVDQSVHGNDFWQTDYDPVTQQWRITYNVALGPADHGPRVLRFASDAGRP